MMYTLKKEELLDFARRVFEASVDNYMDLKDQTCEHILDAFLADKKTLQSNTNLTLGSIGVSGTQLVSLGSIIGDNRDNALRDNGSLNYSFYSVSNGSITQSTVDVPTS